jgi:hypothetical protein
MRQSAVLFVFLLALIAAGCGGDAPIVPGLGTDEATEPASVAALDTLAADQAPMVSLDGTVVDQEVGANWLVLNDGSGLLLVELPEALPDLVGMRLFVRGRPETRNGDVVLRAVEWLYDSTAVFSRSP